MPSPQRLRTTVAGLLLCGAAVFIAVAASEWLVGAGADPRDDVFSRAAGIEFTDTARRTLFSVVPVAAPALAAWLVPGRVIRRLARVLYAVYLVIGVLLALSAAKYGFDQQAQLESLGRAWVEPRSAVERLLLDAAWLTLAVAGWLSLRWNGKREGNSTRPEGAPRPPED
ncbi:hypothetical protein [Glycomyces xiaoerkulensis]|uniref:hypothetical protein n=1 Tax=Glycomyces xiaoerkulensis TaxID=2038139 RepID=UPI000C25B1C4|nr:hypothetical protein [Glycomyces xiaoerkulensis]